MQLATMASVLISPLCSARISLAITSYSAASARVFRCCSISSRMTVRRPVWAATKSFIWPTDWIPSIADEYSPPNLPSRYTGLPGWA